MKANIVMYVALSVGTLMCAACSTVYEGKYERDAGWRRGTILEVAQGKGIVQAGWRDCRKDMPEEIVAKRVFATVKFFGSHRESTITVPLQEGAHFKGGDQVYVNIKNCQAPVEVRLQD
ncbi:MAG: hypothetical protein JWN23_174 [Rhodocyclales bacterium]|nr:hypothetical protein [Rhodocyclales bacterium]